MEREHKYNIGDEVTFKRGELTGKSIVREIIFVYLIENNMEGATHYVLDYCPNGEIFKESELSKE